MNTLGNRPVGTLTSDNLFELIKNAVIDGMVEVNRLNNTSRADRVARELQSNRDDDLTRQVLLKG